MPADVGRDFAAEREQIHLQRRRAAWELANGTADAAERLAATEAALERVTYEEELAGLAAEEAASRAQEADERRRTRERKAAEARHRTALAMRDDRFREVQALMNPLEEAIRGAIAVGDELHDAALQLGWMPERDVRTRLEAFLGWRLAEVGLTSVEKPWPQQRVPLVSDISAV